MQKNFWLVFLIVLASFFGCEEDEECLGCHLNPKVKIQFQPTKTKLLTDSLYSLINEKITDYLDSLDGELSADERNALLQELEVLREDSSHFGHDYTLFRSGKTRINEIEAFGAMGFEQFQDTIIRDFALPVDMQHDTSTFYFRYHTFADTLQVYYQREVIQSIDGVRMRLHGIGVNRELTTFDSVYVKCYNRDCANDLTTVFIYF